MVHFVFSLFCFFSLSLLWLNPSRSTTISISLIIYVYNMLFDCAENVSVRFMFLCDFFSSIYLLLFFLLFQFGAYKPTTTNFHSSAKHICLFCWNSSHIYTIGMIKSCICGNVEHAIWVLSCKFEASTNMCRTDCKFSVFQCDVQI